MNRKVLFLLAMVFFSKNGFANPVLGNVAAGNVTFSNPNTNTLQINQSSNQAIINWQSFNIAPNQQTHFIQPSSSSIALNRISPTQGASQIYGQLTANGQIILVNQAGIYFGPNSYVNVGGIIASTADISDQNFLNRNYKFDRASTLPASIINQGSIIAKDHGLAALAGTAVSNTGLIQAHLGKIVLASGDKFTVSLTNDQLINFTVDQAASRSGVDRNGRPLKNAVNNSGRLIADGGTILMTAKTAENVVDHVINMSGVAQARSVAEQNGQIILSGEDTAGSGNVVISGKMDVSGGHHQSGGKITVLANNIYVASTAKLNASGDNGGNITVSANNATVVRGSISATGGSHGGNGGFLETSGAYLDVNNAKVNLSAPRGTVGTWLLDPTNIYIANSLADSGMPGSDSSANTPSGSNPTTFAASGTPANSLLLVSTLQNALNTSNVLVTTQSSGTAAGDINIVDPITWSTQTTLTLRAYGNINFNANASINNSANNAGLILMAGKDNLSPIATQTVNFLGTGTQINLTGNNATVNIYYNSLTLGSPTDFSSHINLPGVGSSQTVYQFINGLGSDTDMTQSTLASLSNNSALWGDNFALNADINANNTSLGWNGGAGLSPIGNQANNFHGKFDGQGYTINNLFINNSTGGTDVGLFGDINNSTIQNVNVTNANVTHSNIWSVDDGILVGQMNGNSLVDNVFVSGTMSTAALNYNRVGGIIGNITSTTGVLSHASSTATVFNTSGGYNLAGGLVGSSQGTITQSYFAGNVSNLGGVGLDMVGGIAGENTGTGIITDSYNIGTVFSHALTFNTTGIGGVVGINAGTVNNTYNTGPVSGTNEAGGSTDMNIGGVVGFNAGTVNNSYNVGTVQGTSISGSTTTYVGGFVGAMIGGSIINNGYSTGFVSVGGAGPGSTGGFAATSSGGTVNNGYWDTQTSGQNVSAVGLGRATAQLQTNLASLGFSTSDWSIISGDGTNPNGSYPYLRAFNSKVPRVISGFVPNGSSGATGLSGTTVQLANAGSDFTTQAQIQGTVQTGSNGFYYFLEPNNTIEDGSAVLTYLPSGSANSVTVAPKSGGSITGLNMQTNTLSVGDNNANKILTTTLVDAISGSLSSGILYTATPTLVTMNPGDNFTTTPTTDYNVDNTISTSGGGTIIFNGPVSINSTVSTISVASGQRVTIGSSGNVSGLNGSSNNQFIIDPGATVGSLTGGGGTNTLTLHTTGATTINLNGTIDGSVSGGATIGNFFNIGMITGGSGANTFQLTSNAPLTSINGGSGGNNTLADLIPGNNSVFNVTGSNSGSVPGVTSFTNIQNLIGNASPSTGNTFMLTGSGSLSGLINGGNTSNVNTVDLSGELAPVNLALGAPVGGLLNTGVLTTAGGVPVASFTSIQKAVGNGGVLTLPAGKTTSNVIFDPGSTTSGTIGDPFVFSGFTLMQSNAFSFAASANIANIITAPELAETSSIDIQPTAIFGVVQNLNDMISHFDAQMNLQDQNTYCY